MSVGEHCALDLLQRAVIVDGMAYALSEIELRLLYHLARHKNAPVSHQDLIEAGWGPDAHVAIHSLHVYIGRIRKAVEAVPKCPRTLVTLHRVGYILHVPTAAQAPNDT